MYIEYFIGSPDDSNSYNPVQRKDQRKKYEAMGNIEGKRYLIVHISLL